MPIISLQIIKKPRKSRRCETCHKYLDGETIRLYGMADQGDKPYPVYVHRECLYSRDALQKLQAVEHRLQAEAAERESLRRFMAGAKLGLQNGLA